MKKKLAGLLLFSQAVDALESNVVVDKSNYKQHLCDDSLFLSTTGIVSEGQPNVLVENLMQDLTKSDHQHYCSTKLDYEKAIDYAATASWRRMIHECAGNPKDMISPAACVEKTGIYFAQACEMLKADKAKIPNAWNAVIPKLVSCNTMR